MAVVTAARDVLMQATARLQTAAVDLLEAGERARLASEQLAACQAAFHTLRLSLGVTAELFAAAALEGALAALAGPGGAGGPVPSGGGPPLGTAPAASCRPFGLPMAGATGASTCASATSLSTLADQPRVQAPDGGEAWVCAHCDTSNWGRRRRCRQCRRSRAWSSFEAPSAASWSSATSDGCACSSDAGGQSAGNAFSCELVQAAVLESRQPLLAADGCQTRSENSETHERLPAASGGAESFALCVQEEVCIPEQRQEADGEPEQAAEFALAQSERGVFHKRPEDERNFSHAAVGACRASSRGYQEEHADVLERFASAGWKSSCTMLCEHYHVLVVEDTLDFLANAADDEELRGNRAAATRLCHQGYLVGQVHLFAEGLQRPPREVVKLYFEQLKLAGPRADFQEGAASFLELFLFRAYGKQREPS